MEEMQSRFEELVAKITASKDPDKMRILMYADAWGFKQMAAMQPKMAQKWLDKIEASEWHNYLSPEEAELVVSGFVNQNGTKGPKWPMPQFEAAVTAFGGQMQDAPYYNKYALWVTANMIYSDHAKSLSEVVSEADMPKVVYKMAVEKLKDPDRTRFVRPYFGL
jgi:hypothetical protein|uniref:DUF7841 family protein n=1 Tax=Alistipes shahii TaxID=328814 RepID=UPI00204E1961|nr:MAG TPA: hypothetical protein [Caudoviricetes sp.]